MTSEPVTGPTVRPGVSGPDGGPAASYPAQPDTDPPPAGLAGGRGPRADRVTRLLCRASAAGIGSALVIMVVLPAAGPSRAVVTLPGRQPGPPWWLPLHLPVALAAGSIWYAVLAGGAGVAAGLAAVARGARPPVRLLLGTALAAAAVLTVTPAGGSTDTLDYAAYGRMVVIGHDPYVMTPQQLRQLGDPVGGAAPQPWQRTHSVYGPLATIEQATAAELGGTSAGLIAFWLKVWNALAFGAVVLALDRLLRHDPGRRARAHLLWTVNPLLLWILVAGGHVDALAAALGFLGLIVAGGWAGFPGGRSRWRPGPEPGRAPDALRGLTAGALIGAATDLKITFGLFALGLAWAARRSPPMLLASAAGTLAVLVPSYLWFGPPALTVLAGHSTATGDNLYRVFVPGLGPGSPPWLAPVAFALFAMVAVLLLRRLPGGHPGLPAVRPALIFSLAWLLTWPYQRPWYDAMLVCLLALHGASRLDWPVLARLTAATFYSVPGIPGPRIYWQHEVTRWSMLAAVPAVRLAALVAVTALCLTAAWYPGQPCQLRIRRRGGGASGRRPGARQRPRPPARRGLPMG